MTLTFLTINLVSTPNISVETQLYMIRGIKYLDVSNNGAIIGHVNEECILICSEQHKFHLFLSSASEYLQVLYLSKYSMCFYESGCNC